MKALALNYLFQFLITLVVILIGINFMFFIYSITKPQNKKTEISEFIVLTSPSSKKIAEMATHCYQKFYNSTNTFYCYSLLGNFSTIDDQLLESFLSTNRVNYRIIFPKDSRVLLIYFNSTDRRIYIEGI